MNVKDKVIVVTGGASGIGEAMCRRFAAEGAKGVVVSDYNGEGAVRVADEIGGLAVQADVGREEDIKKLVDMTIKKYGPIDLFCSNAGISATGGAEAPDALWQRCWDVHVMSHVFAARAVLPSMIERGGGYLLPTGSAGGLLTTLGAAPYAISKHAAVAFAEWLSITHAHQGIKVSCLCPLGVKSGMLSEETEGVGTLLMQTAVTPEVAADCVIKGLEKEEFLILTHPEVADFFRHKAGNYERWLRHMRREQAEYVLGEK
ncbi:MAG: SDR family oxidoreductase [Syntrophales bacterium]|jgi:NAD(P)-dependent dehydrogenase (short-subunit alcohol dehydrogenase family)|nr:SDR family oxidoreductase [Syntrophales bacterium]MDY0044390.1 SDR family oxidoreductase [Syntrophales bacterium]